MRCRFLLPGTGEPRLTLQKGQGLNVQIVLLLTLQVQPDACYRWHIMPGPITADTIPNADIMLLLRTSILFRPHE